MEATKRKRTLIFIFVALVAIGLIPLAFAENNDRIQKEKKWIQKFNQQSASAIGKYSFPLTVNSFVKDLGQPDSTFTDDNESCPVGQIHTWYWRSQNFKVLVLGDHHNPKVDYSAESRLFAVTKCEAGKNTGFTGVWGINLGDPDARVTEKLSQIVKKNRWSNLKTNIEGPPIHVLLNGFSVSHHHSLRKDGLYLYFVIDKGGNLNVIIQSSFDLSVVC